MRQNIWIENHTIFDLWWICLALLILKIHFGATVKKLFMAANGHMVLDKLEFYEVWELTFKI